MSAAGYVNKGQFVAPKTRMLSPAYLMRMASADVHSQTVAEIADEKRAAPDHAERVEQARQRGVRSPVLLRNGALVDGHHRVVAAYDAGVKQVPAQDMR